MKTIRCQNRGFFPRDRNGKHSSDERVCGRILGEFTDRQIELLSVDPEECMILRCPACKPMLGRWNKLYHNGKGLVQEALSERPEPSPEPDYADVVIVDTTH